MSEQQTPAPGPAPADRRLDEELRAVRARRGAYVPAAMLEVIDRATADLAASGRAERALAVGARAPRFALPSATGRTVALDDLLAGGPVVLTFYRGTWCPFCVIALRALRRRLTEITARGARLVAVSPQVPDESLSLVEKHALDFDVLSDVGSAVARQYGLDFRVPDALAKVYEGFRFEMDRVNGGHGRTLPLTATYVIDQGSTIRWAFVDADYTRRAEPADVLTALDALRPGAR
ncbi:alkyl hydroperoxide reductase [Streptomyces sp. CC53]|uniref:peroxiredoxin-like family protein n=1 Tax=unclassified Streptomyces TaxID=2593676 RepID=UPI0008DD7BE4|nr:MULTISPECIES: peroxiredoxin-like family protein [unclassified Streptomyces]OII66265.1 alkyl hydroperoxide reductase [Streptomyces sp. CC53]